MDGVSADTRRVDCKNAALTRRLGAWTQGSRLRLLAGGSGEDTLLLLLAGVFMHGDGLTRARLFLISFNCGFLCKKKKQSFARNNQNRRPLREDGQRNW